MVLFFQKVSIQKITIDGAVVSESFNTESLNRWCYCFGKCQYMVLLFQKVSIDGAVVQKVSIDGAVVSECVGVR